MSDPTLPFGREEALDKPGIIGARWWQRSLQAAPDEVSRRKALGAFVVAGTAIMGVGAVLAWVGGRSSDDYRFEPRRALDMQREYGWSFGANAEPLTFDGASTRPFDREALPRLPDDLRPARADLAPFYQPTLFQAPAALPRSVAKEETTPPVPLKKALTPIFTPAMDTAYRRGQALARLFQGHAAVAVVVVDLPGPEAVAFAAGAVAAFDPVFAFDNWPHPRGVVPAHLTLAAAAFFQPLFAKASAGGPGRAPLLVLDRSRLAAYRDDASQFDNRYLARLPGASALRQLAQGRVLYVAPFGKDRELDDLNDDFVLDARAGVEVRLVGADAFGPDPSEGPASPARPSSRPGAAPDDDRPSSYYGHSAASNGWFWRDYAWLPPSAKPTAPVEPSILLAGASYRPAPRVTPFSSGAPSPSSIHPRPSGFGTVPVAVSLATGVILGARIYRSGSWNRSSGGWGG